MKKVIFSAALLMAFATASFAGTPKGESTKPGEAKVEAKTTSFTYWVVGRNSDGTYQLVDQLPEGQDCLGGADPCQIQTNTAHSDMKISQTDVATGNGVTIIETQDL